MAEALMTPHMGRGGTLPFPRRLAGFWPLVLVLFLTGPAFAVPQVGAASFAVSVNDGWSDEAFGLSEAHGEQGLEAATPQFLREVSDNGLVGATAGPLLSEDASAFGRLIGDVALVSPFQGPSQWTATCTPDPITVCREVQDVGALSPDAGGEATTAGRRADLMPVVAGAALVLVVLAVLGLVLGRNLAARRRLAAG